MPALKPRAPVFAAAPDSATLIVAAPFVQNEVEQKQFVQLDERDVSLAFNVVGSSTEPVLPRVADYRVAPTKSEPISVEYGFAPRPSGPISVDDYYGFAPRPTAPSILPRMVTDPDLLRRRPSFARRAARAFTSFVSVLVIIASVLAGVVLAFSWAFNVPLDSVKANARTYEGIVALTQVGPVVREPVVFAAPAVRPHAPVIVPEAIAPRGKVASSRAVL